MISQRYLDALGIAATAHGGQFPDDEVDWAIHRFNQLAAQYSAAAGARQRAAQLTPTYDLVMLGKRARETVDEYAHALATKIDAYFSEAHAAQRAAADALVQEVCDRVRDLENVAGVFTVGPGGAIESSPILPLVDDLVDLAGGPATTKPRCGVDAEMAEHLVAVWQSLVGEIPGEPKNRKGRFVRFVDAVVAGMQEVDRSIPAPSIYNLRMAIKVARGEVSVSA